MAKNALDYSRLVRACGFGDRSGDEKDIKEKVLHFLNQNFSATVAEFGEQLERVKKEIRNISLQKYRKPSNFEAALKLVNMPPPLKDWDFLSYTDPQKTGILCGTSDKENILLTEESFKPFDLFERESMWGDSLLYGLCFSLSWWREAVCCVWAGIIMNCLIRHFQKKSVLALPAVEAVFSKDGFADPNEKIGSALELKGTSDKKAEDFYHMCEQAALGSASCETDASEAFKEWLCSANIGVLQKYNLDFEEAHMLLLAGSQRRPEMEIELQWNQKIGAYQFVCLIENNDLHGYKDKKKTAGIPANILLDFFKGSEQEIKEDLIRLLIRGGWRKAQKLLYEGLNHHTD